MQRVELKIQTDVFSFEDELMHVLCWSGFPLSSRYHFVIEIFCHEVELNLKILINHSSHKFEIPFLLVKLSMALLGF